MSDSEDDDDDDLLLLSRAPTFARSRQARHNQQAARTSHSAALDYIDEGLEEERQRRTLHSNIVRIKQENVEEQLTLAETMAREAAASASSSSTKMITKRKQAILADDGYDNEYDYYENNDENNAQTTTTSTTTTTTSSRRPLKALALRDQLTTALDTARSTTLGTRHVLGRYDNNGNDNNDITTTRSSHSHNSHCNPNQWSTTDYCLEDLRNIIQRLKKQCSEYYKQQQQQQHDDSTKDKQQRVCTKVVSLLEKAIQHKTLEQCLIRRSLVPQGTTCYGLLLPMELMEWLFVVACSASPTLDLGNDGTRGRGLSYSKGAFQTLQTLFCRAGATTSSSSSSASSNATSISVLLTLDDMIRDLKAWYGLIDVNSSNDENDDKDQDKDSMTAASRKQQQEECQQSTTAVGSSSFSSISVIGLEHFLTLWQCALANNLVGTSVLQDDNNKNDKSVNALGATATQCLSALALVGLDPYVCNRPGLRIALQSAMAALLSFVEQNVLSSDDDEKRSEWMELTASVILNQCNDKLVQTCFVEETEHEDNLIWLCVSRMARTVSPFVRTNVVVENKIHREFRIVVAMQALQRCLQVTQDWNAKLQSLVFGEGKLLEAANSKSLPWQAIASSYAGFLILPSLDLDKNSQHCLAVVEMISYCAVAGIDFYENAPIDPQEPCDLTVLRTSDDASLLLVILGELQSEGQQLKSRLSRLSSDPNMSRAEYILSCLRRYTDIVIVKARARSGQAGPTVSVQKKICNFFSSPGSDDMEEED